GVVNAEVKSTANSQLRFATSGVDRVTIDSSGKVGIGTISPSYNLQISASNQLGLMVQGPGAGVGAGIQLDATGTRNWEILATGQTSAQGPAKLNIRNLGTVQDVFTITDSGDVGIGTVNPMAKLTVDMTDPTSAARAIEAYSNGGVGLAFFQ